MPDVSSFPLAQSAHQLDDMTAELLRLVDSACVASCSCLTKTPEPSFHAESCRYRVLRGISDALRDVGKNAPPMLCLAEAGDRAVPYLRLDIAFGRAETGMSEILSELTSRLRSFLPLARFQDADPRPLMEALGKAEAALSFKPSLVPMENHDDG